MTPKRIMAYSAAVWTVTLALGSYLEIRWDHAWWAVAVASLIRGVPLGVFLVGLLMWTAERHKRRTDEPPEVDD